MTTIGQIDQAVLLLRERLRRLNGRDGAPAYTQTGKPGQSRDGALLPLRGLIQNGRIGEDDLRKAVVRTLLTESLGVKLADSLEFQSISDEVLRIVESSDAGRELILKALSELG